METRKVRYLSDEEEELVGTLRRAGLRKNESLVLFFLARHPGATTLQISQGTDLSQPTQSRCISILEQRGLVSHTRGPGRNPCNFYSVTSRFADFITEVEQEIRRQEARCREEIRKAKKMG